ncbi:MAG: ferric reductase-like transmembrane domain-containing protein [Tannerella sp.]|nr:ferric reductase-like transmembrane domain-containing protein [Tannerella sp.]
MVKLFIDFIQFLYTLAPLFMALSVLTLLAVLLSKSIKRHAAVYYTAFAIPFVIVAIPFIGRLFGIEMFNFGRIPLLGGIIRDYVHAGTLGFPLLIIIMYAGALNPKNPAVKKLLGIRKELSILSGFPILTHSLIRATGSFPDALRFFTDNEGYMAGARVTNALGAGITSFSFVLGILMLALFLPLWITSFDFVRRRMGSVKWKKLQQWSYVLYAMLFIHAAGIQAGAMLNPREGREAVRPAVEAVATVAESPARNRSGNPEPQVSTERSGRGDRNAAPPAAGSGNRAAEAGPEGRGGHPQSPGFADIHVSAQTKRCIHMASLLLIFGSYLYLRLRKARLKKQ